MASEDFHLLSVEAETGQTGRLARSAVLEGLRRWRGAGRRLRATVPADDLEQAGWGVVFAEDADPAIREALTPLLRHRQGQAGERFRELTYRSGEAPGEFRSRLRCGYGPVDPNRIPYYLLLVGDPQAIPHGFQAGLDVPHAVGRLCLESVDAYERYANSVRAEEGSGAARTPKLALFSPTHGDDEGTRHCVQRLASHLVEQFSGGARSDLDLALIGRAATRRAFLELLAASEASLILTAGHGVMYRSGHPLQRELQGALVCGDWSGMGRVQREHIVDPADVPVAPAGPGRLLFLFGCFTGGTPRLNGYDPRPRAKRGVLTEVPFVARFPQVLLERNTLAVVAHVDQACADAFMWEKFGQVEVFQDCLASVLAGHRVGFALEAFAERYAQIATEMVEACREIGDGDYEELGLRLWTAYHDARGMVVLGDPAVRLATAADDGAGSAR